MIPCADEWNLLICDEGNVHEGILHLRAGQMELTGAAF